MNKTTSIIAKIGLFAVCLAIGFGIVTLVKNRDSSTQRIADIETPTGGATNSPSSTINNPLPKGEATQSEEVQDKQGNNSIDAELAQNTAKKKADEKNGEKKNEPKANQPNPYSNAELSNILCGRGNTSVVSGASLHCTNLEGSERNPASVREIVMQIKGRNWSSVTVTNAVFSGNKCISVTYIANHAHNNDSSSDEE